MAGTAPKGVEELDISSQDVNFGRGLSTRKYLLQEECSGPWRTMPDQLHCGVPG